MLLSLRIRNLVIVEDLALELGPGLNLLTGEPGAGKSIFVDALALIAGGRGDRSMVRSGEPRAIVEALFECTEDSPAARWCRDRGVGELEDGQLVVHREISSAGSGRVLLNGSPCTLALLRELGQQLLELHGQHQQQSLLAPERHLALLDRFGAHDGRLEAVGETHRAVGAARERFVLLREQESQRSERLEALEQTVREIDALAPRTGELDLLDRERRMLRNADAMAGLLNEVVTLVYDGEPAAASLAAAAAGKAEELAGIDPTLEEPATRLRGAAIELQDAGAAIRDYRDRMSFDPSRLEEVEARRVSIERLCQRHGLDEAGLHELQERAGAELATLRQLDDELAGAREATEQAEQKYVAASAALSRSRRAAARKLIPAVEEQFKALALAKARFDIAWSAPRGSVVEPSGRKPVPLSRRGTERAEFMLAANPGEPLRALGQVASGGELSRIMLALHVVAEDREAGRALVFDEVDAGVGGAVADAVGARLGALARGRQVLCVTHLPQVAAYADEHFGVSKSVTGGRTVAKIVRLVEAERVEELARMLGGKRPTSTSREHAAALLNATGHGGADAAVARGNSRRRA